MHVVRASVVASLLVAAASPGRGGATETQTSVSFTPPLGGLLARNGAELAAYSLGRLGVAVETPRRVWAEGMVGGLLAGDGAGWEAAAHTGVVLGAATPAPETWAFRVPVYAAYRHVVRPRTSPTDSGIGTERMHTVGVGLRPLLARATLAGATLTFAIDAAGLVPIARAVPEETGDDDERTRAVLDVALVLGVSK